MLNEDGQVLKSKVVPSDEGKHIQKTLTAIWQTKGRTAVTGHVFTDNSVKGNAMSPLSYLLEVLTFFRQKYCSGSLEKLYSNQGGSCSGSETRCMACFAQNRPSNEPQTPRYVILKEELFFLPFCRLL